MARIYNRKQGNIPYVAGKFQSLELLRNYHVQRYNLTLEVNATNAATNVNYYNDNLFRLISSLTLVANGSINLKQISGEKLVYNYILNNGVFPYTSITKTASGTYTQKQSITIDLVIPNEVRPQDTILNTGLLSTLFLNVTWADASALGTGITVNSANLCVGSEELIGYSRNKGEKINYFKEVAKNLNIISDNNNQFIKLDVNQFYTGFLLVTKKGKLLTNDILKNIRIKSGTTVFSDTEGDSLQRINENLYKLQNSSLNTGLYYLDFTPRNKLTDMLNTVQAAAGFNSLELELDIQNTDATTTLDIYPEFVEITSQTEA